MSGIMDKLIRSKKLHSRTTSSSSRSSVDYCDPLSPTHTATNGGNSSPSFSVSCGVLQLIDDDPRSGSTDEGDLGRPTNHSGRLVRKARIAKNLQETLSDSSALAYFIQFMESKGLMHLIKFWLDAQSFKVSAKTILSSTHDSSNSTLLQRTRDDAGSIFAKYIGKDAVCSIGVTDAIRESVINRICREDGLLDPECFQLAQEFVFQIIENRYFIEFVTSIYYCKHQVDVLTSGKVVLADILHNQSALPYFMELLDRDGKRSLVEFWLAADSFAEDLKRRKDYSVEEAQADAMVLYDKYFSMQASHPVEFADRVRMELELNICRAEGGPLPDCFDHAQRCAYALMEQCYLNRFLKSSLFKNYLSELIHTIENTLELPNPNRRRHKGSTTGSSDHSSDFSFSSTTSGGTFRAKKSSVTTLMDNNSLQQRTSSNDTLNSVDEKSTDAQPLWQRQEKLNLAEVDELGRYHRKFDDKFVSRELPMTKRQKIRNKMKNLLQPDDPKEAELADAIAQLIIADIKNQVSTSSANSSELPSG
uniref:RGS domain-containing protein n=1 Tax=Plectus sambesii TaxID=2011161 RepID=A0A914WH81_9BILA